jgi:hypothetical protein
VCEVGQFVQSVDDVRRVGEPGLDVSSVYGDDGAFSGFDESAVFLKQLIRAAALGVVIVPNDIEQTDAVLRIAKGLTDDSDSLFDRNDGLNASFGECRFVVYRSHARAESWRVEHDGSEHSRQAHIDRKAGLAENLSRRVHAEAALLADEFVRRALLGLDAIGHGQSLRTSR